MKPAKEIMVDAIIGGGLPVFILALAGVSPDEFWTVIRNAQVEARALLLAIVLAFVLLWHGGRRWWCARRARGTVMPVEHHPPAAAALANNPNHVEVGDYIPEISTVEYGGPLWTTTMPPVPESVFLGNGTYTPSSNQIEVRSPPICPRCRTDVDVRKAANRTLEQALAGEGSELFCVNCDWTHPLKGTMAELRKNATVVARGMLRRLERG
jgi:hypothetical protein